MSHVDVSQTPTSLGDNWTVIGDLRARGTGISDDANYDCRDALRGKFPDIDFDPESSCFFAYAKTEAEAAGLADAIDLWVKQRRHPALPVASSALTQFPYAGFTTGQHSAMCDLIDELRVVNLDYASMIQADTLDDVCAELLLDPLGFLSRVHAMRDESDPDAGEEFITWFTERHSLRASTNEPRTITKDPT